MGKKLLAMMLAKLLAMMLAKLLAMLLEKENFEYRVFRNYYIIVYRLTFEIQRCFKYLKLLTRDVTTRSVPWVRSWSPCLPCCWKRSRISRVEKLIEHQESFSSSR